MQVREEARQFLDWENADLLRDCMSIVVRDTPVRKISTNYQSSDH
jgi:hypothetical protein